MRVAALYDIHGMADALDAVLEEVEHEQVDAIVLGGDVVGGPQPAEVLARLRALQTLLVWIRGNGERALVEGAVTPGEEDVLPWTLERLASDDVAFLGSLPERKALDVDGLGATLFCHAVPESDDVLVTDRTPERYLAPLLAGVGEPVVVSGHTHMQFDRRVGAQRWVNAGSVGMAYEDDVAAFWALLGPDVELRRTPFDRSAAADAILATGWPHAEPFVRENVHEAASREEATAFFEQLAVERGER